MEWRRGETRLSPTFLPSSLRLLSLFLFLLAYLFSIDQPYNDLEDWIERAMLENLRKRPVAQEC